MASSHVIDSIECIASLVDSKADCCRIVAVNGRRMLSPHRIGVQHRPGLGPPSQDFDATAPTLGSVARSSKLIPRTPRHILAPQSTLLHPVPRFRLMSCSPLRMVQSRRYQSWKLLLRRPQVRCIFALTLVEVQAHCTVVTNHEWVLNYA